MLLERPDTMGFTCFELHRAKHCERTSSESPLMPGRLSVGSLISEMSFRFPSSHFHLLLYEVVKPAKTSVWRGNQLLEDLVCMCSVWEFHGHQRLSRNTGFPSKHLTIPEDPFLHDWPHSSWFTFCLLEPLV